MTEQEALEVIRQLVQKVSGRQMKVLPEHDLRDDNILDSLDTLVFFMELEKETGLAVPDTESLVEQGWYSVGALCAKLAALDTDR